MNARYNRYESDHEEYNDDQDEESIVPLSQQRVFGAGISRKPIDFVPASDPNTSLPSTTPIKPTNVGARYLSIVMGKEQAPLGPESESESDKQDGSDPSQSSNICAVCKQPLLNSQDKTTLNPHESSIAHQICLEHSYQPSNLGRDRVGVKYLTAYGWDVDSRKGLGAKEEGIRFPIKVKEKNDTVGLRESIDPDDEASVKKKRIVKTEDKVIRLDAKKIRQMDIQAKKRAEQIRQSFYGPDLEQYLGPNS